MICNTNSYIYNIILIYFIGSCLYLIIYFFLNKTDNIDKISFNIGDIDYRWLNENGVWINQPLSILTKLVYEKSKYAESQGDYDAIVKMCHEEFNYICNNTPE